MIVIVLIFIVWFITQLSDESWKRINEIGTSTFSFFSSAFHLFKEAVTASKSTLETFSFVCKEIYYAITTPTKDLCAAVKELFGASCELRHNRQQKKIQKKESEAELIKKIADALLLVKKGNPEGRKQIAYLCSLHGKEKILEILKEIESYGCGEEENPSEQTPEE